MFSSRVRYVVKKKAVRYQSSLITCDGYDSQIVRVSMNAQPVNSMGLSFITEMKSILNDINKNSNYKGVIIRSNCRTFCAGLNLNELHTNDSEKLDRFWTEMQDLCYTLYGMKQAVVAEVAGHAPAGGTILALCCDSRIAAPGVVVGLNESAFGLSVPTFVNYIIQDLIGTRVANRMMQLGTLYKSEEALKIGLIDSVVSVSEGSEVSKEVEDAAIAECQLLISAPGREVNKYHQRKNRMEQFLREREADKKAFLDILTMPETQRSIEQYLASIKSKKK